MYQGLRILLLSYFITHIPITLLVDAQIVFGELYPVPLQALFAWYVTSFGDIVLRESCLWLKSFIYSEVALQLPFFFYAVDALWNHTEQDKTFSVCALAYGVHVATTVLPIISTILFSDEIQGEGERWTLVAIYLPYFGIPLFLALEAAGNLVEKRSNAAKQA